MDLKERRERDRMDVDNGAYGLQYARTVDCW